MNKPHHTHDCDKCVYLGSVYAKRNNDFPKEYIDCYWCVKELYPSLTSVIGRFGSDGPDYSSSHPPEAFADPNDYLMIADRWYLFALLRATELGLYRSVSNER